jgi:hypothetical protein
MTATHITLPRPEGSDIFSPLNIQAAFIETWSTPSARLGHYHRVFPIFPTVPIFVIVRPDRTIQRPSEKTPAGICGQTLAIYRAI